MRRSVIIIALLSMSLAACKTKDESPNPESAPAVTEAAEEAPAEEVKDENKELVSVTIHPLVCKSPDLKEADSDKPDSKSPETADELATGTYPEIRLTREGRDKYPNLKGALDSLNDTWSSMVRNSVGVYGTFVLEDENATGPYASEVTATIDRLDDALVTICVSYYDYSGGAHPGHYIEIKNIDPMTGEAVKLSDIATKADDLPKIIESTIYETYPELEEEIHQYNAGFDDDADPSSVFKRKLAEDTYSWELTEKGLEITFSPYDIASYATGYIDITIPYDRYPDLVDSAYIPEEKIDVSKLIKSKEEDPEEIEPAKPEGMWEDGVEEATTETVENPTWERFVDDECQPAAQAHLSLKKLSEKKTDWLDTGRWADENGFTLANMPYNDDEYYYEPYDPVQYDYMYNAIRIYDRDRQALLYDLDLHTLINGPDEKTQKSSLVTEFIRWAKISGDVLYVAAGHNTYASSEPDSSYILAIRLSDAKLLWRSEPLVSNALNFVIDGDTIICGYGFTAEDDFIYLLDRNTGEKIDTIKVNSGPDQFEAVGDTLYVATYNTAYTFKITRP